MHFWHFQPVKWFIQVDWTSEQRSCENTTRHANDVSTIVQTAHSIRPHHDKIWIVHRLTDSQVSTCPLTASGQGPF